MKARLRLVAVTAAVCVLGLCSPVWAEIPGFVNYRAVWHNVGGTNQWDVSGAPYGAPVWGPETDPPGPAEQLTVNIDTDPFFLLAGYVWLETGWLDQQSVPPTAPTIGIASGGETQITPMTDYPVGGPQDLGWTYAWELYPQPSSETVTFPSADYFNLHNSLASVELGILYGIEPRLALSTFTTFEVRNRSELPANDFHLRLDGIPSWAVWVDLDWSSDYSASVVQRTDTGSEISWENGTTESGASSRFGYETFMQPLFERVSGTMEWTQDGNVIASVPDVLPNWSLLPNGSARVDVTNRSTAGETIWVQRRVNELWFWNDWWDWEFLQEILSTPDLRETTLWEEATLIDPEPIALQPGETLLYDFPEWLHFYGQPAVMMYELFEDDRGQVGESLMTFVQLAVVVPEPSTLSLLLLGGLTIGGLAAIERGLRSA